MLRQSNATDLAGGAGSGGAIFFDWVISGSLLVSECKFIENEVGASAADLYAASPCNQGVGNLTISDSSFVGQYDANSSISVAVSGSTSVASSIFNSEFCTDGALPVEGVIEDGGGNVVGQCEDCNGDGLNDLGQIQSGALKDYDGNLVPDVCEAVQWSVESGGNGHWYQVTQAGEIDWYESELFSIAKGGHLVSITSSAENEFVLGLFDESIFNGSRGPWIGGLQPGGSSEPDGGWSWSNGDVFDFTGWIEGAPDNNCNGINEDRIHFGSPSEGIVGWDDLPGTDSCVAPPKSFITEWSADCNNDGLVDFGQLITGSLEDKNNDGVPDCCADGQTREPDCDAMASPTSRD